MNAGGDGDGDGSNTHTTCDVSLSAIGRHYIVLMFPISILFPNIFHCTNVIKRERAVSQYYKLNLQATNIINFSKIAFKHINDLFSSYSSNLCFRFYAISNVFRL